MIKSLNYVIIEPWGNHVSYQIQSEDIIMAREKVESREKLPRITFGNEPECTFNANQEFSGYLVDLKLVNTKFTLPGGRPSPLAIFQAEDGSKVECWPSSRLHWDLEKVPLGTRVFITFLKEEPSKTNSRQKVKIFNVERDLEDTIYVDPTSFKRSFNESDMEDTGSDLPEDLQDEELQPQTKVSAPVSRAAPTKPAQVPSNAAVLAKEKFLAQLANKSKAS